MKGIMMGGAKPKTEPQFVKRLSKAVTGGVLKNHFNRCHPTGLFSWIVVGLVLWPAWLSVATDVAVRDVPRQANVSSHEKGGWTRFEINTRESLRRAITDLMDTFGNRYPRGREYLARLELVGDDVTALDKLRAEALPANPLLDFERLLVVKRKMGNLGLSQNWQIQSTLHGIENEIAVMAPRKGQLTTFYKPNRNIYVGDVDLHFNADRMLISTAGTNQHWHVIELDAQGQFLRQVTPDLPGAGSFDACYLPDDRVLFVSTAPCQAVPCVGHGDAVGNLYLLERDGTTVRRLTFDQDQNWSPTVLASGRVTYSRWEYSDIPHYWSRIQMHMNPDGSDQKALLFSNSYWPNSVFYARPIPGKPTMLTAIVSGHHWLPRMGELLIFDVAKGHHETEPVVQRIPGYGRPVDPVIADELVRNSWPKFLHPFPLSEKYILVSAQAHDKADWQIYLADIFDNLVSLAHEPGWALLEPLPFRPTPRPPVIPDQYKPDRTDATLVMLDVYEGPGLAGVPRGTVKSLRLSSFHYGYHRSISANGWYVGIDGPWDIRRILGTVPVESDGSAHFTVPANVPISIQPLDADGRAVQVMRSWYTAIPGERLSCVGCHENPNQAPPQKNARAVQRPPSAIRPWHGPERNFHFAREVQPVLDRYCVGCHDGKTTQLNLRGDQGTDSFKRSLSYDKLHRYVRRPGPESGIRLRTPMEWHASTSELVQLLEKGHHNVKLDAESWDRLYTWIDLNVPYHGYWSDYYDVTKQREMRTRANRMTSVIFEDWDAAPTDAPPTPSFVKPPPSPKPSEVRLDGWPWDLVEARRRQEAVGLPRFKRLDLGDGLVLEMALIPPGRFVMGNPKGADDERATAIVTIPEPFYMSVQEVSNEQYRRFDPHHDSGHTEYYTVNHSGPQFWVNTPKQPVVRVTWEQARAYCDWLSQKTGRGFALPTEAQWEYACRAGTGTPMFYGDPDSDFTPFANLADQSLLALNQTQGSLLWIPHVAHLKDGHTATAPQGRRESNPWGLFDMHGNVAEWTLTTYRPYPYNAADGRDVPTTPGRKVVRGGSFYDRPYRAASSFRVAFDPWQRMGFTGFRIISPAADDLRAIAEVRAKTDPEALAAELSSTDSVRRYAVVWRLGELQNVPAPIREQIKRMASLDQDADVKRAAIAATERFEPGAGLGLVMNRRPEELVVTAPADLMARWVRENIHSTNEWVRGTAMNVASHPSFQTLERDRLRQMALDPKFESNEAIVRQAHQATIRMMPYREQYAYNLQVLQTRGRDYPSVAGDAATRIAAMRPVPADGIKAIIAAPAAHLGVLGSPDLASPETAALLAGRLNDSKRGLDAVNVLLNWNQGFQNEALTALIGWMASAPTETKAQQDQRNHMRNLLLSHGNRLTDPSARIRGAALIADELKQAPADNFRLQQMCLNLLAAWMPEAKSHQHMIATFSRSTNPEIVKASQAALAALETPRP